MVEYKDEYSQMTQVVEALYPQSQADKTTTRDILEFVVVCFLFRVVPVMKSVY